ncbi:EpsD family peptidyl-prolyl cis-trans isomerase [Sphingomonas sp. ID0503]|uniref:EpsD family peptidyl-prolyl cis-trans isomerase n=1 Tax=Sphingomonas sp. ID0503 TaxID=3399691 RepID=UPI003AFA687B
MPFGPMKRSLAVALIGASALALAACGPKAPEGQVVATVDGEEVTLPEVNAEAQAANVPADADKKQIMPALVKQVVDRKLLVEVAKEKGIDKSPEFLVQKRRMEELLMAELLAKQLVGGLAVPTKADIDKFMGENPSIFAQRTGYALEQIRFARPTDASLVKQLEPANTLDEVAAILTKNNVKFERGPAQLDAGTLPPEVAKRIRELPAGMPFVVPTGQIITVSVVKASQPIAVPQAAAQQLAANALRQQNAGKTLTQTLDAQRAKAKITYQPGYAPPAPGAPAAGAKPAK